MFTAEVEAKGTVFVNFVNRSVTNSRATFPLLHLTKYSRMSMLTNDNGSGVEKRVIGKACLRILIRFFAHE